MLKLHTEAHDLSWWNPDPSIFLGCGLLVLGYLAIYNFRPPLKIVWFISGLMLIVVALVSPIDTLSDNYLFSAHMLQHLLLMQLVPPLLLLGLPENQTARFLSIPVINRIERFLANPPVAWLAGVVTLLVWHLPFLYDAALEDENIHIFQHICFLVSATIFWWPVLTPVKARCMAAPTALIYLFGGMIANSALGIVLTFSPAGLYENYLYPADDLNILPTIRQEWGITPAVDQQLGGLLMWIPGNLAYLFGIIAVMARWFNEPVTVVDPETSREYDRREVVKRE